MGVDGALKVFVGLRGLEVFLGFWSWLKVVRFKACFFGGDQARKTLDPKD